MSAWDDHRPRRHGYGLPLLVLLAVAVLFLLWHFRVQVAALALCGVGVRIVLHRAGYRTRRRPRTSWAKLLESFSLAVVAWNSRYLRPNDRKPATGPRSFVPRDRKPPKDPDWPSRMGEPGELPEGY
jgi:hypothetical protein